MGVHLLVEAYLADDTGAYTQEAARQGGQDALDTFTRYAKLQDEAVAKLRRENEDTVEDMRTRLIWLRAPITYISLPNLNEFPYGYVDEALRQCDALAKAKYAGYSGWRLPTDPELHEVVKGGSSNGGNANGEPGIFTWLIKQGFQSGPGNGQRNQRGFLTNAGTTYFSRTLSGISGDYYEALWDNGVDFACIKSSGCGPYQDNVPQVAGAWCVTVGKSE